MWLIVLTVNKRYTNKTRIISKGKTEKSQRRETVDPIFSIMVLKGSGGGLKKSSDY